MAHVHFFALLDVGLKRTTTGARIFGALKGALDGGLDIPHSETRFAGYDPKEEKLYAEDLRSHIFGGHVAEYMEKLSERNPAKYQAQFSKFIANGITHENMEEMYKNGHAAIRANPDMVKTENKFTGKPKRYSRAKISYSERKNRIAQKKASHAKALAQE